jgi:hypothetical protein
MWLCAITKVYKDLQSYLPFDWMEIKWIVPPMHHQKLEKNITPHIVRSLTSLTCPMEGFSFPNFVI